MLQSETQRCLDRLETLIDPVHLDRVRALWRDCQSYQPISHLPFIVFYDAPNWPQYSMDEIQADMEKMLVSELAPVYASCLLKDDRLPMIRANYGTGILPSIFGCEIRHFDHGVLPAALPLHDTERIRAHVSNGVPNLRSGLGGRVLDTVAFFRDVLQPYPNLRKWVSIDLADTQGPLDAGEVIWGSEIFLAMIEEPNLVHAFLGLVTETISAFSRAHQAIDGIPFHATPNALGRVCVREDAGVMVSGKMYDTFCKPYTQRLLDEFSGSVHWCGDGKAWWRSLVQMRNLTAVNPYQGVFYDPVTMHAVCRAAGVMIWQWTTGLTETQREQIRTGFTMIDWASDLDTAKRKFNTWCET